MARCNTRRGGNDGNSVNQDSEITGENPEIVNINMDAETAAATAAAEERAAEAARAAEEARNAEAERIRLAAEAAEAERARIAAETARQEGEARMAEIARLAAAAAAAARNAEGPGGMDALMGMMAQVLARVPIGGVPQQNRNDGEANQVPSYLKVLEQMRKMGTKYFPGSNDLLETEEWKSRLERNFDSVRCPEQYKREIAVHFLEGDAHLWWRGVTAQIANQDCTYEFFLEKFKAKYFPEEAYDRLNAEFLELQQGGMTVREYEAKFNSLKVFCWA